MVTDDNKNSHNKPQDTGLIEQMKMRRNYISPETEGHDSSANTSPEKSANHHLADDIDAFSPMGHLVTEGELTPEADLKNSKPAGKKTHALAFNPNDLTKASGNLKKTEKKESNVKETHRKGKNHSSNQKNNKHNLDNSPSSRNDVSSEAKQGPIAEHQTKISSNSFADELKKKHKAMITDKKNPPKTEVKKQVNQSSYNTFHKLTTSPMLQQYGKQKHESSGEQASNQSTPNKWDDKVVQSQETEYQNQSKTDDFKPIIEHRKLGTKDEQSSSVSQIKTGNNRAPSETPNSIDQEFWHVDQQSEDANSTDNGQSDSAFDKFLEYVQTLLDAVKTFYDYAVGVCTKMYEEATSYVNKHWPEFRDTVSCFISPLSSSGVSQGNQNRGIKDGGNASKQTSQDNSNRNKPSCCG